MELLREVTGLELKATYILWSLELWTSMIATGEHEEDGAFEVHVELALWARDWETALAYMYLHDSELM